MGCTYHKRDPFRGYKNNIKTVKNSQISVPEKFLVKKEPGV